nr:VAN3-binding protein isoform X2 [Ipomoea batatas]
MEFLARAWSVSATELSKALSHTKVDSTHAHKPLASSFGVRQPKFEKPETTMRNSFCFIKHSTRNSLPVNITPRCMQQCRWQGSLQRWQLLQPH